MNKLLGSDPLTSILGYATGILQYANGVGMNVPTNKQEAAAAGAAIGLAILGRLMNELKQTKYK